MGQFSFRFAEDRRKRLRLCEPAYVPFPKDRGACGLPPGSRIFEPAYDCYGHFGGKDIFDLVADWNKGRITPEMIDLPDRSGWSPDEEGEMWYRKAMGRYYRLLCMVYDFQSGMDDAAMASRYGQDWKRTIGIAITGAGDYVKNSSLPYPLKVCMYESTAYEEAGASSDDPHQGR